MAGRLLFLTALLLLAPHVSLAAPQPFSVYSNLDQSAKTFSQQLSVYHYQTRLLDLAVTDYDDGDYADALVKFNLLSRLNNAEAQYYLALMYKHGLGVANNNHKAMYWMLRAAKQGNDQAILLLKKTGAQQNN